jgi:hypothetical protein
MDIIEFIRLLDGVSAIFRIGYVPSRREFYELTPEQYERYYESQNIEDNGEKIFMLLPADAQKYNEIAVDDVYIFTEEEIDTIMEAENLIDKYCKDCDTVLETFEDKLYYTADLFPDGVASGTKYSKNRKIYLDMRKKRDD